MKEVKDFTTQEERQQIEADMVAQGWRLIETQYHFDGNHLIFENDEPEPEPKPEPEPRDPLTEIDDLKARVERLETKVI